MGDVFRRGRCISSSTGEPQVHDQEPLFLLGGEEAGSKEERGSPQFLGAESCRWAYPAGLIWVDGRQWVQVPGQRPVGLNSSSSTHWLHDLGQITSLPGPSDSSSVNSESPLLAVRIR